MYTNKPFILLGAPCSGLSFLADLCNASEISVITPKTHQNKSIFDFHNKMLQIASGEPTGLKFPEQEVLHAGWSFSYARDVASECVDNKTSPWGWADSRNIETLNMWACTIPDACYLAIVRNPSHVAESLNQKYNIQHADGYALWWECHKNISSLLGHTNLHIWDYARLIEEPGLFPRYFIERKGIDVLGHVPSSDSVHKVQQIADLNKRQCANNCAMIKIVRDMWEKLQNKCINVV